jgi:uncharacterized protein
MKFLLWGLIVAAVVLWVLRAKKALGDTRDRRADAAAEQLSDAEPMVCCARCGIHLPSSESVPGIGGQVYCSEEHRRLADGA